MDVVSVMVSLRLCWFRVRLCWSSTKARNEMVYESKYAPHISNKLQDLKYPRHCCNDTGYRELDDIRFDIWVEFRFSTFI